MIGSVDVLKGASGTRTLRVSLAADALGAASVPGGRFPVTTNGDDGDVCGYVTLRRVSGGYQAEGPLLVDTLDRAKRLAALADAGFPLHARLRVSGESVVSLDLLTTAPMGAVAAEVLMDMKPPPPAKPGQVREIPGARRGGPSHEDLDRGLDGYIRALQSGRVDPALEHQMRDSFDANGGGNWWNGGRR